MKSAPGSSKLSIPGSPPSPDELGRSGWNILHSSAATFPFEPTPAQQDAMRSFIYSWSQVYACHVCAQHMQAHLERHPPDVRNKIAVSRCICELHNAVNENLGKEQFDCSPESVLRRWHPGYPSNMGDRSSTSAGGAPSADRAAPGKSRWASFFGMGSGTDKSATPRAPASPSLGGAKPKKPADDETDVDEVLRRLRGCQVYCPEDDEK